MMALKQAACGRHTKECTCVAPRTTLPPVPGGFAPALRRPRRRGAGNVAASTEAMAGQQADLAVGLARNSTARRKLVADCSGTDALPRATHCPQASNKTQPHRLRTG